MNKKILTCMVGAKAVDSRPAKFCATLAKVERREVPA